MVSGDILPPISCVFFLTLPPLKTNICSQHKKQIVQEEGLPVSTSDLREDASLLEFGGEAFGMIIRSARRAAQLSQATVAKSAMISPVFLSQIENGKRFPSDRVAKNLSLAVGLPWRDLGPVLYRQRSREAMELFTPESERSTPAWRNISETPAIRFLLMQLAELRLPMKDTEMLIQNWQNDVTLLGSRAARASNE